MLQTPPNPYATDLGDRDPLDALADTPGRIRDLVQCWTPAQFERTYAPGKWTARQVLVHLAQTELALGTRARFAMAADDYVAQPFSQDEWMRADGNATATEALDTYLAVRRMNLALLRRLTPEGRARAFRHPEYGTLTIWWIAAQLAGHDIHHLKQLAAME